MKCPNCGHPDSTVAWTERRWSREYVVWMLGKAGRRASAISDETFPSPVAQDVWLAADVVDWLDGRYDPRLREEPPQPPAPTKLYRHFDAAGRLLYVGISISAVSRLGQHNSKARWADDIARVEIETFPSREAAIDAEARSIREEHPLFNIVGRAKE